MYLDKGCLSPGDSHVHQDFGVLVPMEDLLSADAKVLGLEAGQGDDCTTGSGILLLCVSVARPLLSIFRGTDGGATARDCETDMAIRKLRAQLPLFVAFAENRDRFLSFPSSLGLDGL